MKITGDIVASRWPQASGADKLLLVDGHAYAYRAFYAIRALKDGQGRPTNAIYGFIKMLHKMEHVIHPTHIAVIWDGGLSDLRVKLLPSYKAQRPPMPEDLSPQIESIADYLGPAGITTLSHEGVEADDLIGAAARAGASQGMKVIVASSDKDFMQLVSKDIGILNPNDKVPFIWDEHTVAQKTGVTPGQIVDWLSMIGDSVDNILGIQGVGPKTAAGMLNSAGTLEAILANPSDVATKRIAAQLLEFGDRVRRNQRLIKLPEQVDVPICVSEWTKRKPNTPILHKMYLEWGFRSMAEQLEGSDYGQQTSLF